VLNGGVVVVDLLDVCIVEGVDCLVGSEKVVCGEGFAGVVWECFRGAERKMALDFKVLKIDHGVFFLYFIANNQVDTKMGHPAHHAFSCWLFYSPGQNIE
jgi:hypothetical protein